MKSGSHREPRVAQAGDGASPSPATLDELRERIERLEEVIRVNMMARAQDPGLDETALNRAIRELARGNRKPLERYLRRGGKIPSLASIKGEKSC
ncbi:MAG: hypothetical protein GX421_08880 [Caldisericales bacterium]|nr:hypothetical protein [Caldisericales bacterium]